jgi:hypothetical protein
VLLGTGLAATLMAALGMLVVSLSGATPLNVPGFPAPDRRADAPSGPPVTTSPAPKADQPVVQRSGLATTTAPNTTTPSTTQRPGNGRRPTRTQSHPKPTKNG